MAFLLTAKSALLVLLLAFAFSSFILSIIYINKQVTFFTSYAPGVAAFLAAGACHMLYQLWLVASGGRGKINKSSTVLAIQGMFLAWYFAIAVTLTVKKWDNNYCPPGPEREASGCVGIMRALIAVCWFDFGLTLIWMAVLAAAASTYGGFRVPEGDLMTAEEFEARENREKAGH
jgi:hypothetical protein